MALAPNQSAVLHGIAVQAEGAIEKLATGLAHAGANPAAVQTLGKMADTLRQVIQVLGQAPAQGAPGSEEASESPAERAAEGPAQERAEQAGPPAPGGPPPGGMPPGAMPPGGMPPGGPPPPPPGAPNPGDFHKAAGGFHKATADLHSAMQKSYAAQQQAPPGR